MNYSLVEFKVLLPNLNVKVPVPSSSVFECVRNSPVYADEDNWNNL